MQGYHLVPLAETRVPCALHPRVQMHPDHICKPLPIGYQRRLASQCDDPMALQAKLILREVLRDLRAS